MTPLPDALAPEPVGRRKLSREALSGHQRDRILDAAIGSFAKRGYKTTTVEHIAAAAKIAIGTFYVHFDNRLDCFLAAYERTLERGRGRIEAALPAGGRPSERVLTVLAELLGLIAAEPLAARLVLVETETAGREARGRHKRSLEALVPELRRCRADSPFASELPETLEVATLGGVVWFLQQRLLRGEASDPAALLPEVSEIVLEPYLGAKETKALLLVRTA